MNYVEVLIGSRQNVSNHVNICVLSTVFGGVFMFFHQRSMGMWVNQLSCMIFPNSGIRANGLG